MPFLLISIAVVLIVAGARGTYSDLKRLLLSDFTGQGNFLIWIVAIGVAGAIGYVPSAQKFSRTFLALIIVAMVLAHRGFFNRFMEALQGVQVSADAGDSSGGGAGPLELNVTPSGVEPGGAANLGSQLPEGVARLNRFFGGTPNELAGRAVQSIFGGIGSLFGF